MSSSSGYHASDLAQAVARIRAAPLFGYRDLLSYVSALNLKVIDYRELEQLTFRASGSYATVLQCHYKKANKWAALKEPRYSLGREEARLEDEAHHNAVANVIQEIRILAQDELSAHPNLPKLIGVCFRDEVVEGSFRPCIVQEYASWDLHKYLEFHGSVPIEQKLRWCLDVARGLCALHSYGLVHGDIHPKNILLFPEDDTLTAKVADLGTCGVEKSTDFIPGTRAFWAPECHPRSSLYYNYSNGSGRDIYTLGLLILSILNDCSSDPFPESDQFSVQHNQNATYEHLALSQEKFYQRYEGLAMYANCKDSITRLNEMLRRCVLIEPTERIHIDRICRDLEVILGDQRYSEEIEIIQDLAEKMLLSDPPAPRVRTLGRMPLSDAVIQRLQFEYRVTSKHCDDPRVFLTMAAFYSGAIASGIQQPWATVAKAQWLLKATQQGYFPAISAIMDDRKVLLILEDHGDLILRIKHPSFESPEIDVATLLGKLQVFAYMPNIDALNILVFLGGSIPDDLPEILELGHTSNVEKQSKSAQEPFGEVFAFERILKWKDLDGGPVDSDATDLSFSARSELERAAYEDNIEEFMSLSFSMKWTRRLEARMMRVAIFGGSERVARHLMLNCGLNPNQMVDNETHLELSVLFGRNSMAKILLDRGGLLRAQQKDGISALHLASRHENIELVRMLCDAMKANNSLKHLLDCSNPTGPMAHWTPLWTAVLCQSYANAPVLLDYGADPNVAVDEEYLVHKVVQPQSPAAPTSLLTRLIAAGVNLHVSTSKHIPPLYTALGTSNCSAVFNLLLGDAGSMQNPRTGETALEEAISNAMSIEEDGILPVYNEERKLEPGAFQVYHDAAVLITSMVRLATLGPPCWRVALQQKYAAAEPALLNKMWVIDKTPATQVLQIAIPP